jgi:hypothetical protein
MNKVDIYVNDFRLDLFDDEEITINLSVQNVQDISKTFTDFTQSFTVPASPRNNEILQHYYNSNITSSSITTETGGSSVWNSIGITWNTWTTAWNAGASSTSVVNTFDGRFRQPAMIEINSIPFRSGVIELEDVQLKGTEPYAYTITFYGDLVTLTDLFGEDYLYDLNFSAYDHSYDATTILDYFSTNSNGTDLIYPFMSPKDNWYYDTGSGPFTGVNLTPTATKLQYYMLKPALQVNKILDAIEAEYGITFSGSFLSSDPFQKLYLWLHRREGYMYEGQPSAMQYEKIIFDQTSSPTPDYYNLTTNVFNVQEGLTGTGSVYDIGYEIDFPSYTDDVYLAVVKNGVIIAEQVFKGDSTVAGTFENIPITYYFDDIWLEIKPSTNIAMQYDAEVSFTRVPDNQLQGNPSQSSTATYQLAVVDVTELMPEIKVKDFLAGILKMYNMVIVPSGTTFLLQPLDDWYAAGAQTNYQNEFDITEYAIGRPSLYREIEFKYQETQQILGYQYQRTYGTAYGELRAFLSFDGEEFIIELPFECPLFERLSDLDTQAVTNLLTYKSITSEVNEDGTYNPYLGAPILFYADWSLDISANQIGFITDSVGPTIVDVSEIWYCNTSSSPTSAALSDTIVFGTDIDPYHLQSVYNNLYNDYWQDYIVDLYDKARRIYRIEAVLPLGKMATLEMNDIVIWNNAKYVINNVQLNLTTGRATFELLNVV